MAVSKWIHCTNKIEFAGMASEGDTEALITGHRRSSNTIGEREVLQTFQLLKSTYSKNVDPAQHSFDLNALKKWQDSLRLYLAMESTGNFRSGRVISDPVTPDGDPHIYPHHSVVPRAIERLCKTTYMLAKYYSSDTSDTLRAQLRELSEISETDLTMIVLMLLCYFEHPSIKRIDDWRHTNDLFEKRSA